MSNMNKMLNALHIKADTMTVGCIFLSTTYVNDEAKVYTYIVPPHIEPASVEVGGLAVVETPKGYSVVMVTDIHSGCRVELTGAIVYQPLIQLVDLKNHKEYKEELNAKLEMIAADLKKTEVDKALHGLSDSVKTWL